MGICSSCDVDACHKHNHGECCDCDNHTHHIDHVKIREEYYSFDDRFRYRPPPFNPGSIEI